jgi:hypothetical protein
MMQADRLSGKQIGVLICPGSQGGQFSVQVDGSPGTTVNGYKDPGAASSPQCIIAQPFDRGNMTDTTHDIVVTITGSAASSATNGTTVEFSGFR